MDRIETNKGVLGSFLFSFVWMLQKTQGALGSIFWFLLIKPMLWYFKNTPGSQRPMPYTIDLSKREHRLGWTILKTTLKINGSLNGLVRSYEAYPRLLGWNERVPLYGYLKSDGLGAIEWLGIPDAQGTQGADFIFLSRPKSTGHLNIIRKHIPTDSSKIIIDMAWINGECAGETFVLGKEGTTLIRNRETIEERYKPEHFYLPPKWFSLAIELALSVGAILGAISAIIGIYSVLNNQKIKNFESEIKKIELEAIHDRTRMEIMNQKFDLIDQQLKDAKNNIQTHKEQSHKKNL